MRKKIVCIFICILMMSVAVISAAEIMKTTPISTEHKSVEKDSIEIQREETTPQAEWRESLTS